MNKEEMKRRTREFALAIIRLRDTVLRRAV